MLTHASGKQDTACKADLACREKSRKLRNNGHAGPAIRTVFYIDELKMWVAVKDEYASVIKYCPFCGIELKTISDRLEAD